MKIAPFYAQALNFRANNKTEYTKSSPIGYFCHESYFFREKDTDKFVQDYILEHLAKNPDIHIVSLGCSSGEEVYSYAIMLDELKDKLRIDGYDISESAIKDAQAGIYKIIENSDEEEFLFRRQIPNSYEEKCAQKFAQYFDVVEERKNSYHEKEKIVKLKTKLPNCKFHNGNIVKLNTLIQEKDVDILLMRNTLYHIPQYYLENIISQASRVIRPEGLFVFGEYEDSQGADIELMERLLLRYGFKPFIYKDSQDENFYNVWKKVL